MSAEQLRDLSADLARRADRLAGERGRDDAAFVAVFELASAVADLAVRTARAEG